MRHGRTDGAGDRGVAKYYLTDPVIKTIISVSGRFARRLIRKGPAMNYARLNDQQLDKLIMYMVCEGRDLAALDNALAERLIREARAARKGN